MIELNATRGRPLGPGRVYPAGSLRDAGLSETLASYKLDVAGAYTSVSPEALQLSIPAGAHIASTKVDGEQWFLVRDDDGAVLVSPNGRTITGIPLTDEADRVLTGWTGILAGELYADVDTGRPRVFDLHSALGGGIDAQVGRLRFAAFDIVRDGGQDARAVPFAERARRVRDLLGIGQRIHPVDFAEVDGADGVSALFTARAREGHEGIVIRLADGRTMKVKPVVTIDAAVVAYTITPRGIGELLLGLMLDHGKSVRLIGRVDTGFSADERTDLASRLESLHCESSLHLSSRSGLPCQWVQPELVVEVSCHELLSTSSDGESIRRWQVRYADSGWTPIGKTSSVSLRDGVFLRVREDKAARLPDIRWSQVGDLIPVEDGPAFATDLPPSEIIRREVYTRRVRDYGIAVRKLVAWKTNREDADPRHPAYAVIFTDYIPARQAPLRTELKVAASVERISGIIENWLGENTGRGWECVVRSGDTPPRSAEPDAVVRAAGATHRLTVAFARSTSPTFPVVRKRIDVLSELGKLNVTTDDSGKEIWFELTIQGGLVENYRRVANLIGLVRRWKSTEVSLNGESLTKHDLDGLLERTEEIRRCWMKRKSAGPAGCRRDSTLGCRCLRISPSERLLEGAFLAEPQWYAVGRFDSGKVQIDRDGLLSQVNRRRNGLLECCPCYTKDAVLSAVAALPDTLSTDDTGYQMVYRRDDGLPAWVWPEHAPLPPRLATRGVQAHTDSHSTGIQVSQHGVSPTVPRHCQVPPATYADVCGQDEAVEAVRDMIELPMRYGHLFESVGVSPRPGGVILAGPPGTGKTLLARAVAGECGAHLEVVSGPELLNPYVGATEQAMRDVFDRARSNAPSVILLDELDSIAPCRSTADAHHQRSAVAQLLTLLDGLEARTGISVLATTNRPDDIDPALRRPGRFDMVVWMKLPDAEGRAAILTRYLAPLRLGVTIDRDALSRELAASTNGASGADLEFLCQTAARLCVKDASGIPSPEVTISCAHFELALASLGYTASHCP